MKIIRDIALKQVKFLFTNPFIIVFLIVFPSLQLLLFKTVLSGANIVDVNNQFIKITLLSEYQSNTMMDIFSSGVLVQFLLIASVISAGIIIKEKEDKTLLRLYTLPINKAHILSGFVLGLIIEIMLIASVILMGSYYFLKINWGGSWFELFVVTIVSTFVAASLGIFIAGVFKNSKKAGGIMSFVVIGMSFLSGDMSGGTSPIFKKTEVFTLNKWISDCYEGLMQGKSLYELSINLLIIILLGISFLVISFYLFSKEGSYE